VAAEEEEAGDEGIDEWGILADLAAFERGLGEAGTGEKIVRKGGPVRDWSTPGLGRPNWGRLRFKEFWDQSNCSAMSLLFSALGGLQLTEGISF
jgi:hypothetical protein